DGSTGPAAAWAAEAQVGQELWLVAPRQGQEASGIEFAPGGADEVVLLGDDTAAPAIARMLEDLRLVGTTARISAYIEVPNAEDELDIQSPDGAEVHWLIRGDAAMGEQLSAKLGWHVQEEDPAPGASDEGLLWETPVRSASGEEMPTPEVSASVEDIATPEEPQAGIYYWIAGESGVIKQLRRFLVRDVGVDRTQVAFMGYWRLGVAMRG